MPTPETETVTELDLNAYADGQLDEPQRARVEDFLSRNPESAARVMLDLRLSRELRMALTPQAPPPPAARTATARLARGLRQEALMRRLLRLAPAASLVAVGWLAHAGFGPLSVGTGVAAVEPPPFVAAAAAAREASLLRLSMRSQPLSPELDAEEMRAATGILLPRFRPDWTLLDAQVFPSPQGPGIESVFESPLLGRMTHFAVRPGAFALTPPKGEVHGAQAVVWFQAGETAHVFIAEAAKLESLLSAAEGLAGTLRRPALEAARAPFPNPLGGGSLSQP